MYSPLVSIIIPVYNGSNYLSEAIDSALAQSYKNIEILVVNDGSNDDGATERIALSYGDKIRYIAKENGGVSSALNLGISNMCGEYFSWLSHDDVYLENKVLVQIEKIRQSKNEHVIVLCSGSLMNSEGRSIYHPQKRINRELTGEALFREFLKGYIMNGLGFLIPKSALDECGKFEESMRYLQDLDYWLRLMRLDYFFVCHEDLLVKTRVHRAQTTNQYSEAFESDRIYLMKKHIIELKLLTSVKSTDFLKLYYLLSVKGNNNFGIEKIPPILKERQQYGLQIRCAACAYFIRGKIRRISRDIFNKVLIRQSRNKRVNHG